MSEFVHLSCDMLSQFPRDIVTPEQVVSAKINATRKICKTQEELDKYTVNHPLKVSQGDYLIDYNVVHGYQGYVSVFYYKKDELVEYMKENNQSVSGFNGECYTDWLYLDMENKEHGPTYVKERVTPLLDYLIKENINYVLFFSGNQGLHLYIPIGYLRVPDTYKSKANVVAKIFMKMLKKQFPTLEDIVDAGVYGINTVFRKPFTVNPKSGLLKTILIYQDGKFTRVKNNNDFFYSVITRMFNSGISNEDIKPHWLLDESYLEEIKKTPTITQYDREKLPTPYGEKVCIYKLLNSKLQAGDNRHQLGLRLMSWLYNEKKYPSDYVWKFMEVWNSRLEDPLKQNEVKNMFKYINTINFNLCKDSLMERFCPKNNSCPDWKTAELANKISSVENIFNKIDDQNKHKGTSIDVGKIFPGIDITIEPRHGRILGITAGGKVGKTVAAMNLALKAKIETLYVSYEVDETGIMKSFAKMLGLDVNDKLDRQELMEATKHIHIISEGRPAFQDLPSITDIIHRKTGKKIEMVILDYLQMTPVYDINRNGFELSNDTQAFNVLAKLAPNMVKKQGWLLVLPTQPTKSVEGGGRVVLLPDSASGGQKFNAMLDYGITMWRPFKNINPTIKNLDDKVISMWLCTNRWGEEGFIQNYNWLGDRRLIQGLWTKPIKQASAIVPRKG